MSNRRHDRPNDKPLFHEGHKRPVTRREFLGQGFLTGAAFVALPSVLDVLTSTREAQAACALLGGGTPQVPFIGVDLAGGANIAGSNVIVGLNAPTAQLINPQTQELDPEGYRRLGLPDVEMPQTLGPDVAFDPELGILFHRDSAMLAGIRARTRPETRANVNGIVIAARSNNDTGTNPHNPIYGIRRAGANGELVQLIGSEPSISGGRSVVPPNLMDLEYRPTKVDRPSDATGLVDTGPLADMLGSTNAGEVMATAKAISEEKIDLTTDTPETRDFVKCVYSQSEQLVAEFSDKDALDPLKDPQIVGQAVPGPGDPVDPIFADANEVNGRGNYRKAAAISKLVVGGTAGAATLEMGGFDYHDSTRSTGERRDFEAGEVIGTALEYAARRGQDLMIYVFSDGSVSSNGQLDNSVEGRGKGIWKGDNGGTAASLILVYGAGGQPQLTDPRMQQVGQFRPSGSVETGAPGFAAQVANSPSQLAEYVILNYIALHGRSMTEYTDTVMLGSPSLVGNYDAMAAFQQLPPKPPTP